MRQYDVAIIGGGIVGLSTARQLVLARRDLRVAVFEKESAIAQHQSGRNSGVIHTGIYYRPGSRKAHMAVEGAREMVDYCRQQGIKHRICGKTVVAASEEELPRLRELHKRAIANGVADVELIDGVRLREKEPWAVGVQALWVPRAAVTNFRGVAQSFANTFVQCGGELVTGAELMEAALTKARWRLATKAGEAEACVLVNCAGLHSDRVARMCGAITPISIMPFRGEYYLLSEQAKPKVRSLVYPVPDPALPFLGVHLTRGVDDEVEVGPNAVLAWAREGYGKTDIDWQDCMEILSAPGAWRLFARYWRVALAEQARSWCRASFLSAARRLLPSLKLRDLQPIAAGIRAQAVRSDGTLVNDFEWGVAPRSVHLLNAPSPAATASIPIGRVLAAKALEQLAG